MINKELPEDLVPVVLNVDNTIHWKNYYPVDTAVSVNITNCAIHWIVMNPKDGVVHLSNNWYRVLS